MLSEFLASSNLAIHWNNQDDLLCPGSPNSAIRGDLGSGRYADTAFYDGLEKSLGLLAV
jgi:hypothetical protein